MVPLNLHTLHTLYTLITVTENKLLNSDSVFCSLQLLPRPGTCEANPREGGGVEDAMSYAPWFRA